MTNKIITISRQFGSGGRTVGKLVAEKLGIPCYDSQIISEIAKKSGFAEEYIKENGEYMESTGFFASLGNVGYYGQSNQLTIWSEQCRIIKELAEKGDCVIVGRCADYALEGNPDAVTVWVKAPLEARVERIKKLYQLTDSKAADLIQKTDKKRASYYNYYSSKKWGEAKGYDLCLDSSKLGIDGSIELIKSFIELKEKNS